MEHRVSKRHQGGYAFQVLLVESTPAYTAEGSDGTFAVELRAKQMRTGIEREYGKGKTLEQMFDTKYVQPTSALAQAALGMTRTMMTEFHKVNFGTKSEHAIKERSKGARHKPQTKVLRWRQLWLPCCAKQEVLNLQVLPLRPDIVSQCLAEKMRHCGWKPWTKRL